MAFAVIGAHAWKFSSSLVRRRFQLASTKATDQPQVAVSPWDALAIADLRLSLDPEAPAHRQRREFSCQRGAAQPATDWHCQWSLASTSGCPSSKCPEIWSHFKQPGRVSWGRWGSLDFNKGAAFLPSSSFPSFPSFLMQLETTPGPQHMPCGISERCRNRCQKKYIRKNFSYIYILNFNSCQIDCHNVTRHESACQKLCQMECLRQNAS